ncbi:hypothetical protein [Kluyvera georgiana]|uniref:hypothetical protein n=1 Tax=Kluyvera georgiana TaxID=73098 RepID=UPI003AF196F3
MRYALIKNGIVVNIVEWDGKGDLFDSYETVNVDNIRCGVGWKYQGDEYIAPPDDSILPD